MHRNLRARANVPSAPWRYLWGRRQVRSPAPDHRLPNASQSYIQRPTLKGSRALRLSSSSCWIASLFNLQLSLVLQKLLQLPGEPIQLRPAPRRAFRCGRAARHSERWSKSRVAAPDGRTSVRRSSGRQLWRREQGHFLPNVAEMNRAGPPLRGQLWRLDDGGSTTVQLPAGAAVQREEGGGAGPP